MFRRTFWFSTGVAAGVWATTKVNRKLRQLTPEHLAVTVTNKAIEAGGPLRDRPAGFAVEGPDTTARRGVGPGRPAATAAPSDRPGATPPSRTATPPRTSRVRRSGRPTRRTRRTRTTGMRTTDGVGRDPPPLAELLRGARAHRRPVGVAHRGRPDSAARPGR